MMIDATALILIFSAGVVLGQVNTAATTQA